MDRIIASMDSASEQLTVDTCEEIFRKLDSYSGVAVNDLHASIQRNVALAIASLEAGKAPEPEDLREAVTTTMERFHSGVSIDQVILAFRMSFSRIHEYFIDQSLGRLEAEELVKGSQILSRASDAFTARAVSTFHKLVVDSAVADASRRAAALRHLFSGGANPAGTTLPLQIDTTARYAALRASIPPGVNPEKVRRALEESGSLPGVPATVVVEDGTECMGIVAKRPAAPAGMAVGIGPFVELSDLSVSNRVAVQALGLASALERTGVQGLQDLNWRLAAAQAPGVGRLFRQRFIHPVQALGEFAPDILNTMHAWLKLGRSMSRVADDQRVHVNTVRYRVSKFSELTGFDPDCLDDAVGLVWALEMPDPGTDSSVL